MGTRPPCRRSNARARDPRARDQPWPRPQLLAPKDQMIGVAHVERRLLIGQPELPLELLGHSEVVLVQERQPDAGRVPRAGVPGTAGPNVGAANALWVIAEPLRGYLLGERVLRPAQVVVAVRPAAPAAGGEDLN
jgi:hypothetical protein